MRTGVSLNPETFTEGTGLIDDRDVIFESNSFVMFDYNGKRPPGVPAVKSVLKIDDEEIEQYWTMGNEKDWKPSEDGKQLLAIGSATGIRASSNGGIFLKSLVEAGFPADRLGEDISILDGLSAHVIRVPAPERGGLKKEKEKKYEDTILVVSEIKALPWEAKKPKGAPAGAGAAVKGKGTVPSKGKGTAAPKSEVGEELTQKAIDTLMGILAENGSLSKKEIPGKIFQALKADEDKNAILKLAFSDEFLSAGPWNYADGVLTLG